VLSLGDVARDETIQNKKHDFNAHAALVRVLIIIAKPLTYFYTNTNRRYNYGSVTTGVSSFDSRTYRQSISHLASMSADEPS
jgi:hypothetical protein